LLTSDDDSGTGFDSQLTFAAAISGAYFLEASEFGNDATGTYSLSVIGV